MAISPVVFSEKRESIVRTTDAWTLAAGKDPDPAAPGFGGAQFVAPSYEIAEEDLRRVVIERGSSTANRFYPLDRKTLPEELAKLGEAADRDIVAFVSRNGFLASHWSEPLSYIRREAKRVNLILGVSAALETSQGNDQHPALEHSVKALIGEDTYRQLREHQSSKGLFIKASWREYEADRPLAHMPEPELRARYEQRVSQVMGPYQPPELRATNPWTPPPPSAMDQEVQREVSARAQTRRDAERDLSDYGFVTEPGGDPPALPMPGDAKSPGAIARFLIRDLINTEREGPLPYSPKMEGAQVRQEVFVENDVLVLHADARPLINAIYWLLIENVVAQKRPVRMCAECGHFFIARDPRQSYCGRPAGWAGPKDSLCGLKRRSRLRRESLRRTESGSASGGDSGGQG
jgi:hypothetical protein